MTMTDVNVNKKKKQKRSDTEIFIDKFIELKNSSGKPISATAFCKELGWADDRFKKVKDALVKSERIRVGQGGGGGLITLLETPADEPTAPSSLSIFISYCHADHVMKDELLRHLKPLEHLRLIDTWHDGQISAGSEWGKEITENIQRADIVLILISAEFINSKYCYDVELGKALEQYREGKTKIIPVILKECMWNYTAFSKFQALPKEAKAISSCDNKDAAYTKIAEEIKKLADSLIMTKNSGR